MLSLFKLPFWGRGQNDRSQLPVKDLSSSIFRNYLSRQNELSENEQEMVQNYIETEFRSLQQSLDETSPLDRYEIIKALLRRVDEQLKRF